MSIEQVEADIVVVGAGIAGAGLAADLSRDHRVVILEMEDRAAYHTTGRSAAIFIQNYGNAVIRALSRVSAPLFSAADRSLFPHPLLSPRGKLTVADAAGVARHRALLAESEGLPQIDPAEAVAMVPILRRETIVEASYEKDAQDIDVHALHQGWLKLAKANGARLVLGAEVLRGEPVGGGWSLETATHRLRAPIVVNAAGAWADRLAARLGMAPVGLQPMRRSISVLRGRRAPTAAVGRCSRTRPRLGTPSRTGGTCWSHRGKRIPAIRTTPTSTISSWPLASTATNAW